MPQALQFGIFDHLDRGTQSLGDQYRDRLALTRAYDEAGFHAYHLAEHHFTPLGIAPSPSVFLSAVAQHTQRLRLGALVYTLSMHHPLRVAEEICMLDQLSGGRLELGFGRGVSPYEVGYYGVDPEQAQSMYHESYQVIMQALRHGHVDFTGQHFTFRDVPFVMECAQAPCPPLWYGVGRPEGADWAASNAVNIVCNGPPDRVRQVTDRYRDQWQHLNGLAEPLPLMGVNRHVVIAPTEAEALAAARRAYVLWRERLFSLWVKHNDSPATLAFPETFDEAQELGLGIASTAEGVRQWVEDHAQRTGINYLVCRFAFGDLTRDESLESVRQFQQAVMCPSNVHA